jgi:biopolymer transport protein ExbB
MTPALCESRQRLTASAGDLPFYGIREISIMPAETSITSPLRKSSNGGAHKSLAALAFITLLHAGSVYAQTVVPNETTVPPGDIQTTQPRVQAPAPAQPEIQPPQPEAQSAAPAVQEQAPPAPVAAPSEVTVDGNNSAQALEQNAAPMPVETNEAANLANQPGAPAPRADIPHNLSPWGMFMAADWVVKAVMIGLAFASLVTWTVWLAKSLELAGARLRAGATLKVIRQSRTLREAVEGMENKGGPGALMLKTATQEMLLSDPVIEHTDGGGIKERVSSALSRIETHAGRRMARGTGMLATIGSTAPFVGLFGTVWGIMNSFISISESQTTNLAVVAPGIAEALLATAIGLVAAIPAVVIYNVFARSITGYRHLMADVAAGVERLVSRDLDFRKIPTGNPKSSVSLVAR